MKTRAIKISSLLLALVLILSLTCCAEKKESARPVEEMVIYYANYGDEAKEEIESRLKQLEKTDKTEGAKWRKIVELWERLSKGVSLNFDVLPDGLPDTDELGIVALGFKLNDDGTVKDELVNRLKVVKKSAEKYPNAVIICTGGGTAANNEEATEAGKMAEWLINEGIDKDRIIVEDKSLTTAQNAIFTYDILEEKYPQIKQLVIISSDYHIATGTLFFEAECILRGESVENQKVKVVTNAACNAKTGVLSKMFQAGGLIELSGDTDTAFDIYYDEYDIHQLPEIKRAS